jgi:hypothetical protein
MCDKETKRMDDFMHRPATNAAHDENSDHLCIVHRPQAND